MIRSKNEALTLQGEQRLSRDSEANGQQSPAEQSHWYDAALIDRVRKLIVDRAFDHAAALLQTCRRDRRR